MYWFRHIGHLSDIYRTFKRNSNLQVGEKQKRVECIYCGDFGETGCDNWFVCLDGEGDFLPDMFIGRFPVKTSEELDIVGLLK